ncbi:MAG TPA: tetratricopeptide repeat protein [Bacteriovoracaceae bacterium]|nr:tetratricopeptide repeat protein [Bacteriovoracaceae bacterium]
MKKLLSIGAVIAIGSIVYFTYPPKKITAQKQEERRTQSSSRKIFLGPRKNVAKKSKVPDLKIDGCDNLKNNLERIDFNLDTTDWLAQLDADHLANCKNEKFSARIASIKSKCLTGTPTEDCGIELVFLRSLIRTDGIVDGEDKETLADLILGQFTDKEPDFGKLEHYTSKLLDLDPSGRAVQKLWAMSKLLSNEELSQLPPNLKEEIQSRVDPDLLDDEQMLGLGLILENGVNPEKIEGALRQRLENLKPSSQLHEALGWSLWMQNRREEARAELSKALQLNPNDPFLKEMAQKITSPTADVNSYQGRLSLGVEVEELFN